MIIEILKGQLLSHALSRAANVPKIYVQQFWHTLWYAPPTLDVPLDSFVGYIDHFECILNRRRLRMVLRLPTGNFEDEASKDQVCAEVRALGYRARLERATQFKWTNDAFVPLWFNLFSILDRYLTSKTTGIDRCSSVQPPIWLCNGHLDRTTGTGAWKSNRSSQTVPPFREVSANHCW